MPPKTEEKTTALAVSDRLIAAAGVLTVDPKSVTRNEPPPNIEEETLRLLEEGGYADIDAAFEAMYRIYGIARFANKDVLADERTQFVIQEIVIRKAGDIDDTHDDWALKIVTEDGEPQILTISMFNLNTGEPLTQRNREIYSFAAQMKRFNRPSPPMVLDKVELSGPRSGQRFFMLVPARLRSLGVSATIIGDVAST